MRSEPTCLGAALLRDPVEAGGASPRIPDPRDAAPGPGEDAGSDGRRGPRASPAARRTLLVAEDDPAVRKLLCHFLEAAGFRVLGAPGPVEALRLASQAGHIDGLVTDLLMPDMSGRELALKLRAERPELPVLFVSASAEADLLSGELAREADFLPKPFDRGGLLRAVHRLMGRE
jgi:CheY-like chemotaxis protein